jgi:hypothetical protein
MGIKLLVAKQPSHEAVTKLSPVEARSDYKMRIKTNIVLRLRIKHRMNYRGAIIDLGSRGILLGIFWFYSEGKKRR